jgi:KaiC/GvpD/RAD55 family RecA-like ATPase
VPGEESVADFVFQLGVTNTGSGRRLRTFEIMKANGANMKLGLHSWSILKRTPAGVRSTVAQKELQRWLQRDPDRAGTIGIFPRAALPAIGDLQGWRPRPADITISELCFSSGTPGLDEMLKNDRDYWARPAQAVLDPALPRQECAGLNFGSTTLLLGRSGTGKSIACLQFLIGNKGTRECKRSLYVNFENRPHRAWTVFPGNDDARKRLAKCKTLYRRRANLDFNLLLNELAWVITVFRIDRIAIDGLSDLLATTDAKEYARLMEDLLVTIRRANYEARENDPDPRRLLTTFITLEAEVDSDVASPWQAVSFAADNVFLLSHVRINDEQRKTIRVLKARGHSPDRQVREVSIHEGDPFPLRIVPGLENYRNLLGGSPTPVRVTLQLPAENADEAGYNNALFNSLRGLFGYRVESFGFARDDILRTLHDIAAGVGRIPRSDVKLLGIDEWWVRELRLSVPRGPHEHLAQVHHPLLRLDSFLASASGRAPSPGGAGPAASDFWVFEVEKACVPYISRPDGAPNPSWEVRAEMVACPNYLDFGLFCINSRLANEVGLSWAPEDWPNGLARLPRVWAYRDPSGAWFKRPDPALDATVVDIMARIRDLDPAGHIGFAFDMETPVTAACTFLEFCWSFGADEDFLVRDVQRYVSAADRAKFVENHPATRALQFLQFLVVEGLMPARTRISDSRRALFSRHWFSSLGSADVMALHEDNRPPSLPPGGQRFLWPVPFFPVGAIPEGGAGVGAALKQAVQDLLARFHRLLTRVQAAVKYRGGEGEPAWSELDAWRQGATTKLGALRGVDTAPALTEMLAVLAEAGRQSQGLREKVCSSPLFAVGRADHPSPRPETWRARYPHPAGAGADERLWRRLPAATSMDLRDVLYLLDWHEFRIQLIRAQIHGRDLEQALLPAGGTDPPPKDLPARVTALTGYACQGSWMVGVARSTHSPSLAAKFLLEITSLGQSAERARQGAGIPARKDFYDFYGADPAPHFASGKVTWTDFLRYGQSRVRRRDRAFCQRLRVSDALDHICRQVFRCLTVADQLGSQYRTDPEGTAPLLQQVARDAVTDLFEFIHQAMQQACGQTGPCLTCPDPNLCRVVVAQAAPTGAAAAKA